MRPLPPGPETRSHEEQTIVRRRAIWGTAEGYRGAEELVEGRVEEQEED